MQWIHFTRLLNCEKTFTVRYNFKTCVCGVYVCVSLSSFLLTVIIKDAIERPIYAVLWTE